MLNKVYLLKNTVNEKIYVGQTWNSLKGRWNNSYGYIACHKIGRAIKKYGKDKFYYEIICICENQKDADHVEQFLIKKLNTINNGYNIAIGGGNGLLGFKHSDETKKNISIAKLGTIATEEARQNMAMAQTGRKQSKETKEKLSKLKSGIVPYKMTDEIRNKFSILNTGNGNPFLRQKAYARIFGKNVKNS